MNNPAIIRVHYLQLPPQEQPSSDEDTHDNDWKWDRFRRRWILVVNSSEERMERQEEAPGEEVIQPITPADSNDNADNPSTKNIPEIHVGDLLCFKDLFTGAGEMEGVRIVTEKFSTISASESTVEIHHQHHFVLAKCGIEYPVFPAAIRDLANDRQLTLRAMYKAPINHILRTTSHLTLNDVMGGEEDAFWENPDIARQRPCETEDWCIPLQDCTWETSIDFEFEPQDRTSSG